MTSEEREVMRGLRKSRRKAEQARKKRMSLIKEQASELINALEKAGFTLHETNHYIAIRKPMQNPKRGKRNLGAFRLHRGVLWFESTPISYNDEDTIFIFNHLNVLKRTDEWVMFGAKVKHFGVEDLMLVMDARIREVSRES